MTLRKQSRRENLLCSTVPPLSPKWNTNKKEENNFRACAFVWGLQQRGQYSPDSKLWAVRPMNWGSIKGRHKRHPFSKASILAVRQPSPLAGSFPTTDRPRDKVSSHLYLVPSLRMSGPIISFPHTPSLLAPTVELKSNVTKKIYSNVWICVTECQVVSKCN
jgi:hypothetical protein